MDKQIQTRAAGEGWAEGTMSSAGGHHAPSPNAHHIPVHLEDR